MSSNRMGRNPFQSKPSTKPEKAPLDESFFDKLETAPGASKADEDEGSPEAWETEAETPSRSTPAAGATSGLVQGALTYVVAKTLTTGLGVALTVLNALPDRGAKRK